MSQTISHFSFPTPIHFGVGARGLVPDTLQAAKVTRPLIVTDQGVATLPLLAWVKDPIDKAGMQSAVFSGVVGNPVKSQVQAGVAAYRAHNADAVVGLGGGAALDVAKAIALMIHHPGDLFDYEDEMPGARPIDQDIPFFIALPTTAGTGSEVGRSAVISDDETHIKKIIYSPRLLARAVFADPELTAGLPPAITAATGMDALTHCIEAYLAKNHHPICDGIALEGIALAAKSLAVAVANPGDLNARGDMLMASMMGSIAFQKGLGVVHSCAHALGTVCDMHHGLANALVIDFALTHNTGVAAERFARMAQAVQLPVHTPEAFLQWLADLKKQVGIAPNLKAHGVDPAHLPRLAQVAVEDACHPNNPRVCTHQDFVDIFAKAFA